MARRRQKNGCVLLMSIPHTTARLKPGQAATSLMAAEEESTRECRVYPFLLSRLYSTDSTGLGVTLNL